MRWPTLPAVVLSLLLGQGVLAQSEAHHAPPAAQVQSSRLDSLAEGAILFDNLGTLPLPDDNALERGPGVLRPGAAPRLRLQP